MVRRHYAADHMGSGVVARAGALFVGFTEGVSQQLAPRGVQVNTVAPGPVWIPLIPAAMPTEKVGDSGGQTPLGRPGSRPGWPGHVVLASQQCSDITGGPIGVTDGMSLA